MQNRQEVVASRFGLGCVFSPHICVVGLSRDSQFTRCSVWDCRNPIWLVCLIFLTAVTHASSPVPLYAISNYSAVVLSYSSPHKHRSPPFFLLLSTAGRWQGESDFPLDWTQPVPSFKSYSPDLKEKTLAVQLKAASSSLEEAGHLSAETLTYLSLMYEDVALGLNQGGERRGQTWAERCKVSDRSWIICITVHRPARIQEMINLSRINI